MRSTMHHAEGQTASASRRPEVRAYECAPPLLIPDHAAATDFCSLHPSHFLSITQVLDNRNHV